MQSLIVRVVLTWFLFIPIAIINGIVREKLYKQYVGDLTAHQISTVVAAAAFILLSYFMLKSEISDATIKDLFKIGLFWVLMTMFFEFWFGHFIDGVSWNKLFEDYNLFKGRLWGIFLLVIFLTPYIVKILKPVQE